MRFQIVVSVDLDEGLIALDARRFGRPVDAELTRVVDELECRLHDAVRWRDAVTRVGSRVHRQHVPRQ